MAYQQVHTFTSDLGVTYYVMVDFENQLINTIRDRDVLAVPESVTETELNFQPGEAYTARCVGFTYIKAFAQLVYPFCYLEIMLNAVECDYVAPPCTFSYDVTTATATNNGNNGSITISNLLPAGSYQYSLDNVGWQTSPIFNFLFPGAYQIYIRSSTGCLKSTIVNVANTITPPVIPTTIPFQELRKICYFFWLIIDGVTHVIREPIKWDGVNIVGERDPDFHGYLFKYTDGNVDLGFDCAGGMSLIEGIYNADGQDGDVQFQHGYTYNAINYLLFSGNLMLNTYKWYPEKVECTVQTDELDTVFTSRLETKVSMTQNTSFDGDPVPVPTPYNLPLHPKEILTKVYEDTQNIILSPGGTFGVSSDKYIKPDNTNATYNETSQNFQYPLGAQDSNPVDIDEYINLFDSDGQATINIELDMDIHINKIPSFFGSTLTAKVQFVTRKLNVATSEYILSTIDITVTPVVVPMPFPGGIFFTFNIKGSYSVVDNFLKNDSVYCYILIHTGPDIGIRFIRITQNRFLYDLQYLESTATTPANTWFIEDVIRQCINVISNNKYAFRSSLFERVNSNQVIDGCASKTVLTNGYQIRQFDIANRPLKIDLKTVLNSLNSIYCIGVNYLKDSSGSYVRIERRDYYYQDREIIAIEDVEAGSYREEVAIDIIYNEIEQGYNKYQDSGFNSLDEFNTKDDWLTPIKKNKKKLSLFADFITSGYSIEDIRRQQFSQTPSSSVTNDEEPFMICVKRENSADFIPEKNEAFETVNGIISPGTAYNLRVSPARMLYNWFIWLKGIFYYKQDADKIINTLIVQNNDLVTKFNTDELCRLGDVDRATIAEKDSIPMTSIDTTVDLYQPERVFFKCRLSPQQVQVINLAMTSRYGDTKDRGYIMVKKSTGVWQAVWIEKLSYNFWTEKAEISGLKKFPSPDAPVEGDCCKWLVVNGCYLKVNGEKLIA